MTKKPVKIIDYSGTVAESGTLQFSEFAPDVVSAIRDGKEKGVVLIVDRGFGLPSAAPHLVIDHLNLTGSNPLVGPNDPCGDRFPVVNDIYISNFSGSEAEKLPKGIVGGLKNGFKPNAAEEKKLRELGAEFFSYNLAQTMLVAAHAGWKVIGVVLPENTKIGPGLLSHILSHAN